MVLALKLLITLLLELPIIALFFRRKKRQKAILMGLLINIISWSVTHIIFFTFDVNMLYVAIGIAIGEAIAFHQLLDCNWTKAIILSLVVNSLSYFATQYVPLDFFQSKPEAIRTALVFITIYKR